METNDLIQQAYDTKAMTRSNVFKWGMEFRDGRTIELAKDSDYP